LPQLQLANQVSPLGTLRGGHLLAQLVVGPAVVVARQELKEFDRQLREKLFRQLHADGLYGWDQKFRRRLQSLP
jgi:hypothetical protein